MLLLFLATLGTSISGFPFEHFSKLITSFRNEKYGSFLRELHGTQENEMGTEEMKFFLEIVAINFDQGWPNCGFRILRSVLTFKKFPPLRPSKCPALHLKTECSPTPVAAIWPMTKKWPLSIIPQTTSLLDLQIE